MENNVPSVEVFKKMIDISPMGATLWEAGGSRQDWSGWTLIYCNNRIKDFLGVDISGFIGLKASDFPKGFGQEDFDPLFEEVIETGESKMTILEFGSSIVPDARIQFHLLPLAENYMATFYNDITPQMESRGSLEGRVADFQEMNRYMISREVKIAAFKREIDRLQKELKRFGK